MKSFAKYCLVALLATITLGCSHSVKRVDPSTQTDLSGRWNDTDSRLTAEAMIEQMFGNKWAVAFEQKHQKKPVIVVGLINNKSHEHINTETFIKDLEKAIVNNGSIRLVQAGEKREELRRERAGQQEFASPETAKKWGRELGADFMMQGTVNSIVDGYKRDQAVYYQIDLELANIETTEIVWIGDKKIKKMIRN
ncbi:MAG: penicillin-binding protein activator LpoB [Tannerella sp.]|nr:penicillin-binding protein activator LpoB [Tannerella sp.]